MPEFRRPAVPTQTGTPRELAQRQGPNSTPARLYIVAPGIPASLCKKMAGQSVRHARAISPKMSGSGARGLMPYWGEGFFGIEWPPHLDYMWIQESGSKPFTMRSLAGKTIPMWINDPTGKVARENPKAQTRVTESGKRQVKIFRKAAKIGQRRKVAVRDPSGRLVGWREGPASYPGAPGRIARRDEAGRVVSYAPSGHQGVRWRNPGLEGRRFMEHSLKQVATKHHIVDQTVYVGYRAKGLPLATPIQGIRGNR